jgi:hypothetical protein
VRMNFPRIDEDDLKFKAPFTCIMAGPTGSGKTVLLRKIINAFPHLITVDHLSILWCYGVWTDLYNVPFDNPKVSVKYLEGIPSVDQTDGHNLLVLDDLMGEAASNRSVADYFTKYSHHRKLNVVLVVQNLYNQGKEMRNIQLNTKYLILLRNRRDERQINMLQSQVFPAKGKTSFLLDRYRTATEKPFGYLLIDLSADTPEEYRLRTNILPEEVPERLASVVTTTAPTIL